MDNSFYRANGSAYALWKLLNLTGRKWQRLVCRTKKTVPKEASYEDIASIVKVLFGFAGNPKMLKKIVSGFPVIDINFKSMDFALNRLFFANNIAEFSEKCHLMQKLTGFTIYGKYAYTYNMTRDRYQEWMGYNLKCLMVCKKYNMIKRWICTDIPLSDKENGLHIIRELLYVSINPMVNIEKLMAIMMSQLDLSDTTAAQFWGTVLRFNNTYGMKRILCVLVTHGILTGDMFLGGPQTQNGLYQYFLNWYYFTGGKVI